MTTKLAKRKSISKLKKCQYCGKQFEVASWRFGKAKYCSYECSNKRRTTERAYSQKRICKKCGKEYFPTQWNQKYCGRQCFLASIKKRAKVECPTCGKSFIQTRISQKYCSRECGEPYKKKTAKFKKGYIDLLWGELVKRLAGLKCEYCDKSDNLNSHHIFSRSRMATRWDVDNGVCLCAAHHMLSNFSAHKAPIDFVEWLRERRGDDWYSRLRAKAKVVKKYNKAELLELTISLKSQIQEYPL